MRDAVVKYGLFYGALLVIGPVAWRLVLLAVDAQGGHGASLLSNAGGGATVYVTAAVVLAAAVGLVAARLHSAAAGLLDMGVVLAWGAAGLGTLRQVVMARADASTGAGTRATLLMLAVEAAVVGAAAVGAAVAIERLARRVPDGVAGKHDSPRTGAQAWGVSALCGVAGSTVGVWLIAQTGLKGQAVGASLVGSMLGAIGAYALDHRASMWAVLAGSVVVSVAGPVLAMATGGDDAHLHAAVIAGSVSRLALPIGLDAVAGACMGVPVGLYVGNGLMGHASHVAGHVE